MTDKELLKKLKKDKNSGLSVVIDLYSGLLYKIAACIILPTGSNEDVEECVSDSFLAFCNATDEIDPDKASIKTYLALITRRKAIDTYRRIRARNKLLDRSDVPEIPRMCDFTIELEEKTELLRSLKNLGEPDTTIITRKYFLGETAAEIAAAMNMSEDAVQKRIERGRQKLKKELGGVF